MFRFSPLSCPVFISVFTRRSQLYCFLIFLSFAILLVQFLRLLSLRSVISLALLPFISVSNQHLVFFSATPSTKRSHGSLYSGGIICASFGTDLGGGNHYHELVDCIFYDSLLNVHWVSFPNARNIPCSLKQATKQQNTFA